MVSRARVKSLFRGQKGPLMGSRRRGILCIKTWPNRFSLLSLEILHKLTRTSRKFWPTSPTGSQGRADIAELEARDSTVQNDTRDYPSEISGAMAKSGKTQPDFTLSYHKVCLQDAVVQKIQVGYSKLLTTWTQRNKSHYESDIERNHSDISPAFIQIKNI